MSTRRLLIVSGKGGVGKTTVATALAMAAADRGMRTIVVEIAGRRDVARLLQSRAGEGSREVEAYPGLWHLTVQRRPALEEYLREEVPGPFSAAILARSRGFELFVEATPGIGELLTIGKVWELTQRPRHRRGMTEYDLVVLDGPASGQLIGLLQAPRTFGSIARAGPVAQQAAAIERLLFDPETTGVLAVATAEQMAVSETLSLAGTLSSEFRIQLAAAVVNRMFPARFTAEEMQALSMVADDPAARSARWVEGRARAQRTHLARLRRGLGRVPCTTLPFLFAGDLGRAEVQRLARKLPDAVVDSRRGSPP